ncbi:MAG TPA: hypothetical protein PKE29_05730 [Phycisphaerales bacterium]|nr:hypothetical protein [Phycisphaerales bacterium]
MIVFCAADLIWASRIKSTADSLAIPCRPARNPDMLLARLGDSPVRALIVDLDAGPVAFDLIRLIREHEATPTDLSANPPAAPQTPCADRPRIRVLAFGPHVATDLLTAAKAAGADALLARGAFGARLPQILQSLATNPATIGDDLHV